MSKQIAKVLRDTTEEGNSSSVGYACVVITIDKIVVVGSVEIVLCTKEYNVKSGLRTYEEQQNIGPNTFITTSKWLQQNNSIF